MTNKNYIIQIPVVKRNKLSHYKEVYVTDSREDALQFAKTHLGADENGSIKLLVEEDADI